MMALAEREPEPLAPRPVVMADDPCEAALGSADPPGPSKYYRARYYDPKVGRFLSEDPKRWAVSTNFYPYVDNNPTNVIDPYGLQGVKCKHCSSSQTQSATQAVQSFCTMSKSGKCRAALVQYGLDKCVDDHCKSSTTIVCHGPCGGCGGPCINFMVDPSKEIYLQADAFTDPQCGSLEDTVAHEFAHLCGVGPDVSNPANKRKAQNVGAACSGL